MSTENTNKEDLYKLLLELEAKRDALRKENRAMEAIMPFMKKLSALYESQYDAAVKVYLSIIKEEGATETKSLVRKADEIIENIQFTHDTIKCILTGLGYDAK